MRRRFSSKLAEEPERMPGMYARIAAFRTEHLNKGRPPDIVVGLFTLNSILSTDTVCLTQE